MSVLVLNAGSSTLKVTLLEPPSSTPVLRETVDWGADATGASGRVRDLELVLRRATLAGLPLDGLAAVGHRIVHGGEHFTAPVVVDDMVLDELDRLSGLAPLHNPVGVETLRDARELLPDVPHVACFDTAFHATLDEPARRYPVPTRWTDEWGIRRFGFHGLSVAWATRRAAELMGRSPSNLRLVIAHLGSGSSVTAVDRGRSVWTSMGYTPLEGLMMATRAGSIDPGILLDLLRTGRRDAAGLSEDLEHRSGLLAVAGTADMRALLVAAGGEGNAALAVEMYVRRAAEAIASATTALPDLDGLVFTGGIGENAAEVRDRIVRRLHLLRISPIQTRDDDGLLTEDSEQPAVLRVASREDVVIAEASLAVLRQHRPEWPRHSPR